MGFTLTLFLLVILDRTHNCSNNPLEKGPCLKVLQEKKSVTGSHKNPKKIKSSLKFQPYDRTLVLSLRIVTFKNQNLVPQKKDIHNSKSLRTTNNIFKQFVSKDKKPLLVLEFVPFPFG